jgi:hypothetical protein
MSLLSPLLGLPRLDHQRNSDIRNRLKVDNVLEDMDEWTEATYRGWLSSTNPGDGEIWEDQDDDGEIKNTLSFKEQVLRPIRGLSSL